MAPKRKPATKRTPATRPAPGGAALKKAPSLRVRYSFDDGEDHVIPLKLAQRIVLDQHERLGAAILDEAVVRRLREELEATARELERMVPLAQKGHKFSPKGRGKSPIKKAIERLLMKVPTMTAAELWSAIKARPPRGYTVCENRTGKYIEGPSRPDMSYRRFENACSEVRKELRNA